jgi:hypothetical protein
MKPRLWLLLSLLVGGIAWLYMHRLLGPWEYYINVEHGQLKAQLGDLYSPWVGTCNLLLYGRNPYGPEVSHEIQIAFYGHAIQQTYDQHEKDRLDEQRFAYPVYVVFLLAPTVHLDFRTLQAWAPVVLAIMLALTVLLWLDILRWRLPLVMVCAMMLFVISSPQIAQGLRLRQLGLVVSFLLALGAWCVTRNYLTAAGLFLALATIKPQMTVLPVACFLIWSGGDLKKRWRLLASFVGVLALLAGAGEILLPSWPHYFVEGMVAYSKYAATSTTSPLRVLLGIPTSVAISGGIIVAVLIFACKNRSHAADSPQFVSILTASLTGASLALPLFTPFNQVMLILPILIILRHWNTLGSFSRMTFALIVTGPWITELFFLLFPRPISSSRILLLPSALALLVPFLVPIWLVTRRAKLPEPVVADGP